MPHSFRKSLQLYLLSFVKIKYNDSCFVLNLPNEKALFNQQLGLNQILSEFNFQKTFHAFYLIEFDFDLYDYLQKQILCVRYYLRINFKPTHCLSYHQIQPWYFTNLIQCSFKNQILLNFYVTQNSYKISNFSFIRHVLKII